MSRLLSSLTAAAAHLADQAADRLDTWVENTTSTDQAPRDTPLGFTVPTPAAPDTETINIVNQTWQELADHHRDRRIAAEQELHVMKVRERDVEYVLDHVVDGRLNLREYIDPETPAGRVKELVTTLLTQIRDAENGGQVQHLTDALHVANSNNHAIKQELDRTRALLEAAQQDGTTAHLEVSAVMGAYDRGTALNDIDAREDSLAERVLSALIVERGRAEDQHRVDAREHARAVLDERGAALDTITANLHKYGITMRDESDLGIIVLAVSGALQDRVDALQQLRTIDHALTIHDNGGDPGTMTLKHPADTAARVAQALSVAGRKLDAHHRHEGATDADAVRARAAERILAYAAEEKPRVNDTYGQVYLSGLETAAALIINKETEDEPSADAESPFRRQCTLIEGLLAAVDHGTDPADHPLDAPASLASRVAQALVRERHDGTKAAERIRAYAATEQQSQDAYGGNGMDDVVAATGAGFLSGLEYAAGVAADETPEADPNVAHIDTVNGRAPAEYTPGPFAEAILDAGGTIVVDDNGDPHVTDVPLIPTGPGTLVMADGKRHRFIGGTASPVAAAAAGGVGGAPSANIIVNADGYVTDVIEPDEDTDTDTEATDAR